MSRKLLFTALIAVSAVTACSQAKQEGPVYTFEDMDRDANGYISSSEASAMPSVGHAFKSIDTDADGKINITEFQKFMGRHRMSPPEEMETPEPGAAPY